MIDERTLWLIGIALLVVVVAAIALAASRRREHERAAMLRERFGPEYDRTIERYGVRHGHRALLERTRRVERLQFRELTESDRARFSSAWTMIQSQFVDDPTSAVARANDLIKEVMRARGYSADEAFEQRAADLSVDHPDVVQHYRAARALAQDGTREGMNTEELRQAVVHYRVLFADLLQPAVPHLPGVLRPAHA